MPKESRTKVGRVLSAARYAAFMAHSAVASAPPRRPGVCCGRGVVVTVVAIVAETMWSLVSTLSCHRWWLLTRY